jgi:DNA-binding MarR family transcriptional regulator
MLWRVTNSWQRAMRAALVTHGLTHVQFVLLASLWWLRDDTGEDPTQARLAEQAGTDPMMTSQVARKLQARGLLDRAPDPADARAWRVRLTVTGRATVASALADVEAADAEYFGSLGSDTAAFLRALERLDAVRRAPPDDHHQSAIATTAGAGSRPRVGQAAPARRDARSGG